MKHQHQGSVDRFVLVALCVALSSCANSNDAAAHASTDDDVPDPAAVPSGEKDVQPDADVHDQSDADSKDASPVSSGGSGTTPSQVPDPPPASAAGGDCEVNADCVGSEAEQQLSVIRCFPSELYCLDGECVAQCMELCEVVQADFDPCEAPAVCAPLEGGVSACTMIPVVCTSADDCPKFSPPTSDGKPTAWQCTDGSCTHPVVSFATH